MYSNILIPVVFDDGHNTEASIVAAAALADDDATFTVLHVLEAIPSFIAAQIPDDLLVKSHDEATTQAEHWAGNLPNASVVVVSGHAGTTIVDYASDNGIDCIVLASHKPGIQNIFLGSTAVRVLRHAKCSVHVIR